MEAYEIYVNGQLCCKAGANVGISHAPVKEDENLIHLYVGGINMISSAKGLEKVERLVWLDKTVKVGDQIKVKIVDIPAKEIDEPQREVVENEWLHIFDSAKKLYNWKSGNFDLPLN